LEFQVKLVPTSVCKLAKDWAADGEMLSRVISFGRWDDTLFFARFIRRAPAPAAGGGPRFVIGGVTNLKSLANEGCR